MNDRLTVLNNPEYALEAYGIQNPNIREAIRLGAWNDVQCPKCHGKRGKEGLVWNSEEWKTEPGWWPCEHCYGRGVIRNKQDTRILAEDFASAEDLRFAQKHFGYGWPPTTWDGKPVRRAKRGNL